MQNKVTCVGAYTVQGKPLLSECCYLGVWEVEGKLNNIVYVD